MKRIILRAVLWTYVIICVIMSTAIFLGLIGKSIHNGGIL